MRLRIAAKPPNARSTVSAIIAHWLSVGIAPWLTLKTALDAAAFLPLLVTKAPAGSVLA